MIWIPFAGMVSLSAVMAMHARYEFRARCILEGACFAAFGLVVFLIAVVLAKAGGILWLP